MYRNRTVGEIVTSKSKHWLHRLKVKRIISEKKTAKLLLLHVTCKHVTGCQKMLPSMQPTGGTLLEHRNNSPNHQFLILSLVWPYETAQKLRALSPKSEGWSWIHRTHMVHREKNFLQVVPWSPNMHTVHRCAPHAPLSNY